MDSSIKSRENKKEGDRQREKKGRRGGTALKRVAACRTDRSEKSARGRGKKSPGTKRTCHLEMGSDSCTLRKGVKADDSAVKVIPGPR